MEEVQPKWRALQQICREAGIEVMYTVMESMTQDGRDRSLDYKISGEQNKATQRVKSLHRCLDA